MTAQSHTVSSKPSKDLKSILPPKLLVMLWCFLGEMLGFKYVLGVFVLSLLLPSEMNTCVRSLPGLAVFAQCNHTLNNKWRPQDTDKAKS